MSNFTSPAIQAMNLVRYIGDEVSRSGKPIDPSGDTLCKVIGAPSEEFVAQLAEDLATSGLIKAQINRQMGGVR